jgi:hypothetical protein
MQLMALYQNNPAGLIGLNSMLGMGTFANMGGMAGLGGMNLLSMNTMGLPLTLNPSAA